MESKPLIFETSWPIYSVQQAAIVELAFSDLPQLCATVSRYSSVQSTEAYNCTQLYSTVQYTTAL